ncbi:thioredoxin-like protein [Lojkania enalia]|uniref:Thioredoxin-like protein n=1 Tax=Lojkania enalia TaxID=147567 RepID=A0A9P4K6N4_9PLEO|nr:thioredoxin-like protein [Didymosphaeria enalia]
MPPITKDTTPNITLYTHRRCPWAHRAHIVIRELGLPYEEVIIDLDKPREPWYLELNPRGLVPTIKYSNGDLSEEIITESAVVSHFLADAHPSHLVPRSGTPEAALKRARINSFVDTWVSKCGSFWMRIAKEENADEKEKLAQQLVSLVGKEVDPLLKDAAPFFGGSDKFTLAEALVAPFILRLYALTKNGLLPQSIVTGFTTLPHFSNWATEVIKQDSVTYTWDENVIIEGTKRKIASLKAQAQKM